MKKLVLKHQLFIAVVLACAVEVGICFAEEVVEKIDDYSAKITISSVADKDGVKTTVSQEKVFTLEELNTAKAQSESALQSWQAEKIKAEENITVQAAQVALWEKLIDDCKAAGVIDKPIGKTSTEESGE